MMRTMEISGRKYPIIGHIRTKAFGKLPIVDVPAISDYQWRVQSLQERLLHREVYEQFEDVDTVIARLRKWLFEHTENKEEIA